MFSSSTSTPVEDLKIRCLEIAHEAIGVQANQRLEYAKELFNWLMEKDSDCATESDSKE